MPRPLLPQRPASAPVHDENHISAPLLAIKGRGASSQLPNRFDSWQRDPDLDQLASEPADPDFAPRALRTVIRQVSARSIISSNDSPDIPFDNSVNPYAGCEHGCSYCYARPSHAYLGLSPGIDFETRILAKTNGAELLRQALGRRGYQCKPLAIGGNTDPYQPAERDLQITRSIIQVLHDCRHPFSVITKNALVTRDIDLIAPMAARGLARVYLSVTSLDNKLSRKLEPRASAPLARIEAIRQMNQAGIPVGVMVAPVIPFITDRYIEQILELAAAAGASSAGYILLRLPREVAPLFKEWLQVNYPLKADHVMSLVRQMSGGADYDTRFTVRQTGTGVMAQLLARRFSVACTRAGLTRQRKPLDVSQFQPPPPPGQLGLFPPPD